MKIKWLGHSAFKIVVQNGTKILMDPYEAGPYDGGVGYGPIDETVDIVTVSHEQHEDPEWS